MNRVQPLADMAAVIHTSREGTWMFFSPYPLESTNHRLLATSVWKHLPGELLCTAIFQIWPFCLETDVNLSFFESLTNSISFDDDNIAQISFNILMLHWFLLPYYYQGYILVLDIIIIDIVSWFKEAGCYSLTTWKISCDMVQYVLVPKQNYYFPVIPQLLKLLLT